MVLCHKELYIQGYTIYTKKCSFTEVCILKQNLHEKLTESQTNSGATALALLDMPLYKRLVL